MPLRGNGYAAGRLWTLDTGQLTTIFSGILLPVLVLIGLGALVQRRLPLHLPTLSRLNIYLFVPAFLFLRVYESTLSWRAIGGVVAAVLLPGVLLGVPLYLVLKLRGAAGDTIAAMVVGGVVFNAGNFGIPLAELLYVVQGVRLRGMATAADGVAIQALVVMTSNLCIWCLGYGILAAGMGRGLRGALGYFKLPMLYVLVAALLLRAIRLRVGGDILPAWIGFPLASLAAGIVPVSLVTLGAQLAGRVRRPRWGVVGPVIALKLILLPVATALVVWRMGLWPWPGAQIVIASAAPTAVNTLLLTLELEGDADTAADCVFWTTVASAVSVTGVLAVVIRAAGA